MARKVKAIIGSCVFLVIAPGFVAVLVPWWISRWRLEPALFGCIFVRFLGGVLITLGAVGLVDSFARFALQGVGTPAPVFPTCRLVVTGLYRYVRNPMYVAVVSTILGQSLVFGNVALIEYAAVVWLFCHIFVLVYEEPKLSATFGADYKLYCNNVWRWIPRLTPWNEHKRENT